MTKTVFISAGEFSGDKHASYLCCEIINNKNNISFYGFGGSEMKKAGVRILNDVIKHSGVGLVENIPAAYHAGISYKIAKNFFKNNKTDLLILVDNQGFNIRLAKLAKKMNISVIYYIGPQEWIWGFKNGIHKIMKNIDTLYAIFKNEYDFYQSYIHKVKYFGHPLLNILKKYEKSEIRKALALDNKKIIGFMPGSRKQEINNTMPVFIEIYKGLKEEYNFIFIIPEIWKEYINQNFDIKEINTYYGNSDFYMQGCDLIIASSGTVTLEAVIFDIPVIPCYKLHKISYLIAKMLIKPDYVTLPNIVSEKKVINEFLQEDFNSDNIIKEVTKIFNNKQYYDYLKTEFKKIRRKLEPCNSVENTAKDIIINYLS